MFPCASKALNCYLLLFMLVLVDPMIAPSNHVGMSKDEYPALLLRVGSVSDDAGEDVCEGDVTCTQGVVSVRPSLVCGGAAIVGGEKGAPQLRYATGISGLPKDVLPGLRYGSGNQKSMHQAISLSPLKVE